jgi:hypothetical protein
MYDSDGQIGRSLGDFAIRDRLIADRIDGGHRSSVPRRRGSGLVIVRDESRCHVATIAPPRSRPDLHDRAAAPGHDDPFASLVHAVQHREAVGQNRPAGIVAAWA